MPTLYLSLGTNMGDRQSNLDTALSLIGQKTGTVQAISTMIETEPWGYKSDNRFLNMAVKVETMLTPLQVLSVTRSIERSMGRKEKSSNGKYTDRIIDIDLLMYDDLITDSPELTLPHKLMHKRRFVLEPLAQIAPGLEHPVLHKTIRELLDKLD
ncbi:MAG: 2-amino-4-hydroxy-6-hydroxymethyldihydropteridine diphosphokinase [Bacteroidaceae bacterium]|nr:2-amino-4-hydroxy-6-hydroxymethyldihydropteridine diphosphokinase [Bacteroidaceae bacterium]